MSGGAIMSINADLRVGGVSGDHHGQRRDTGRGRADEHEEADVLDDAVIEALPSSRGYGNLLSAVPGIQNNSLDNGTNPTMMFFTAHGGRGNEGTMQIDGMNVGAAFNGGGVAGFGYPTRAPPEVQVTVSGGLGEADRGGPAFNIVPKTGGNTFSGKGFRSTAGDWSHGRQHRRRRCGASASPTCRRCTRTGTAASRSAGRSSATSCGSTATCARSGIISDVPGLYGNKNAGNPNAWSYVEDRSIQVAQRQRQEDRRNPSHRPADAAQQARLLRGLSEELHAAPRTEKGGKQCRDRGDDWIALNGGFNTGSPESGNVWDDREKIIQAIWTSPVTNKLLLEAGLSSLNSRWGGTAPAGALTRLHSRGRAGGDIREAACRCRSTPIARRGASSATTTVSISSTTSGARRARTSPAPTA